MSTIDLLMVGYIADPIEHTSVRTSLMEFFYFFPWDFAAQRVDSNNFVLIK